MQNIVKLHPFKTVQAGAKNGLNIPMAVPGDPNQASSIYHAIFINIGSGATPTPMSVINMRAVIENVELVFDGRVHYSRTGAEILDEYIRYGQEVKTGIFPLYFRKSHFNDPAVNLAMLLGTSDFRRVELRVTLSAGVVSPTMEAWATVEDMGRSQPRTVPLGNFPAFHKHTQVSVASAGEYTLRGQKFWDNGQVLKSILLTTDAIDSFELKVGNTVIRQGTIAEHKYVMRQRTQKQFDGVNFGRVDIAGETFLDFMGDDVEQGIGLVDANAELILQMNAPATFDFTVETLISGAGQTS